MPCVGLRASVWSFFLRSGGLRVDERACGAVFRAEVGVCVPLARGTCCAFITALFDVHERLADRAGAETEEVLALP